MAKGTFGERLKRERELREVSVEELTKATRISQRFLEALENEDWSKLPGGLFARAFVRTIARYLGLDEESLLAEYDAARGDLSQDTGRPEERIPSPPRWIPAVALLGALAVLAGLIYAGRYAWHRYTAHRARQQSSSSSAPSGAALSPATNKVAATSTVAQGPGSSAAALDLAISTSAATRVRVVSDGTVALDAEVPAGETRHFAAKERFEVTAADSSALLLELNSQAMPPLGAPGASGTMVLTRQDLRQPPSGSSQP